MIGERIKQARLAAGLSLRALADQAEVSAMAISKCASNAPAKRLQAASTSHSPSSRS